MTLNRIGAPSAVSWLATADIALAPSPSIEPTASVSVTGRVHQRYPRRPAPANRMNTPRSDTTRSQNGILIEIINIAPDRRVRRADTADDKCRTFLLPAWLRSTAPRVVDAT